MAPQSPESTAEQEPAHDDVLIAKMEVLEMRLASEAAKSEQTTTELKADERPAWWVDPAEAAQRANQPQVRFVCI